MAAGLNYFPVTYPDELWYSAKGRYHSHTMSPSWANTCHELYGNTRVIFSVDFPRALANAKRQIGDLIPLDERGIAWKMSLLPYFAARETTDKKISLIENLVNPNPAPSVHSLLGLGFGRTPQPIRLRTCRDCLKSDRMNYGETYWRRAHQLPGVHFCVEHKQPLVETAYPYRSFQKQAVHRAELDMKVFGYLDKLDAKTAERLLEISARGVEILNLNPEDRLGIDGDIRASIRNRGYTHPNGKTNIDRFVQDMNEYYGNQVMTICNISTKRVAQTWLHATIHQSRSFPPVKAIIFEIFRDSIEISLVNRESRSRGPWQCQNPLAGHYGQPTILACEIIHGSSSSKRTVRYACTCGFVFSGIENNFDRRGQPIRLRMLTFGQDFVLGMNSLRQAGKNNKEIATLVKRNERFVVRYFHKKVNTVPKTNRARHRSSAARMTRGKAPAGWRNRVNWAQRDLEYRDRVVESGDRLRQGEPINRITFRVIAFEIGVRSLWSYVQRGKLPLTKDAIDEVSETAAEFQCRRIKWVFENWNQKSNLTKTSLLDVAGYCVTSVSKEAIALVSELLRPPESTLG